MHAPGWGELHAYRPGQQHKGTYELAERGGVAPVHGRMGESKLEKPAHKSSRVEVRLREGHAASGHAVVGVHTASGYAAMGVPLGGARVLVGGRHLDRADALHEPADEGDNHRARGRRLTVKEGREEPAAAT